jgi:hypothetical protein
VIAWDAATDRYSVAPPADAGVGSVTLTTVPAASAVTLRDIHGQIGPCMTMPSPVTVTWTGDTTTSSISEICYQLSSLMDVTATNPAFAVTDDFVKGAWNYLLVSFDGSKGIHNPTYVFSVLSATKAKLP